MFISDEIVFIELHKTACTHIGKLLGILLDGVQRGKHNPAPPTLLNSNRKFIGSIRNPWDWYVSLWAYGCDKKGLIYSLTTRPLSPGEQQTGAAIFLPSHGTKNILATRKPEQWQRCYSDVNSASAFQDWLHMMHDKSYWNDFGEGYGSSPIAQLAGVLTYRYINLFCKHEAATIKSLSDLKRYENKNCFIKRFIRMEKLEDDFITAMKRCEISLSKSQKKAIHSAKKTNTSSRKNKIADYYDSETIKLISKREKLIIDKFSYDIPSK